MECPAAENANLAFEAGDLSNWQNLGLADISIRRNDIPSLPPVFTPASWSLYSARISPENSFPVVLQRKIELDFNDIGLPDVAANTWAAEFALLSGTRATVKFEVNTTRFENSFSNEESIELERDGQVQRVVITGPNIRFGDAAEVRIIVESSDGDVLVDNISFTVSDEVPLEPIEF